MPPTPSLSSIPSLSTVPGGPQIVAGGEVCRDGCITCGDVAVEVTVVRLLPDSLALVTGVGMVTGVDMATGVGMDAGTEEVSVALVDARVGDTVLVHAGEAIAIVEQLAVSEGEHVT